MSACSSNGKPYAHEAQRHPTAAEQQFGTTGGNYAPAAVPAPVVVAQPATTPQPGPVISPAPLAVPQPVALVAPADDAFVQRVAASNAAEIELSRLAYVRAQSPEVRTFAQQLVNDHRTLAIDLDNFALEHGYVIAWALEPEAVANIDRLSALSGGIFDKAYMDLMVDAHRNAVALLQTQAASGRATAGMANAALPIVSHHLEMARALDARL
jgi:putative membrane protein